MEKLGDYVLNDDNPWWDRLSLVGFLANPTLSTLEDPETEE